MRGFGHFFRNKAEPAFRFSVNTPFTNSSRLSMILSQLVVCLLNGGIEIGAIYLNIWPLGVKVVLEK